MANNNNLKPITSKSRARELGSKGGKKSQENKRIRKSLKESMSVLLSLPIYDTKDFNAVSRLGIPLEDIDNSQLIVTALFNRAKSGDVAAIKELRELIGEGAIAESDHIKELDRVLDKIKGGI